jgi:alpha-L-rhamnosidase
MKHLAFLWLIIVAPAGLWAQPSGPVVTGMQTEHLTDPLGIDATHPRLSWRLKGGERNIEQTAYALVAGTDSAAILGGEGRAGYGAAGHGKIWQTGKRWGPAQLVTYDGPTLQPFTRYYWRVTVWNREGQAGQGPVASFETGMLDQSHWKGSWITDTKDIRTKPAAYFRHSFSLTKTIVSARAYVAAAGLYELSINGKRVGDHVLDPMYTRFDRRNLYVTYDVTNLVKEGDNAIGMLLGNGWYNLQSTAVWYFDKAPWRGRPSFCLDLRIVHSDGTTETISSGKNWKTALSPVVFNSIYTGEHVDARVTVADSNWKPVIFAAAPSQHIVAQTMVPIRITDTIAAVGLQRFSDTDYVFDLGRNIAGVSRIVLQGPAGTVVRLKHGERLYPPMVMSISRISMCITGRRMTRIRSRRISIS